MEKVLRVVFARPKAEAISLRLLRSARRYVFIFLLTHPVFASQLAFSYRNHIIFSNAQDPDDNTAPRASLLMHENTLQSDYDNYRLGVNFANRLTPDGNKDLNRPFALEKIYGETTLGDWEIAGGDSHQELGRGISLSLYKDPIFGTDNTVRGGSVKFKPAGATYGVFGGRVSALKAPVAINAVPTSLVDNELLIAGAYATGEVAQDTKLGGHYFYAANRPFGDDYFRKDFHTLGATYEQANMGDWDVYAESNVLVTHLLTEDSPAVPAGYGSYGAVTWAPSPWKSKIEVKDYRNYGFEFRRPPTLEEDIIESVNISDVSAARMSVEHRDMETKTTWTTSYLVGRDRLVNGTIHHGVVGTRFKGPLSLDMEVRGGFRSIPGKSDLAHVALKFKAHTGKGEMAEIGLRKQYEHKSLDISPTVADKNIVDFTYTFSENFNLGVGYEFLPRLSDEAGHHFFNGGGTLKTGSLTSRAFIGKTSGGTLCSGGVCRQVPPYTGAYLETHLSL